jgi:hypothetical protein
MLKCFKIYRCLRNDMYLPVVWIQSNEFKNASIIKISKNSKKIYVFAHPLEVPDKKKLNEGYKPKILFHSGKSKGEISETDNVLFVSKYYRDKLGILLGPTSPNLEEIEIDVGACDFACSQYRHVRAAFMHPDFSIRSAFYIAFVSLLLGFISLLNCISLNNFILASISLLVGFISGLILFYKNVTMAPEKHERNRGN